MRVFSKKAFHAYIKTSHSRLSTGFDTMLLYNKEETFPEKNSQSQVPVYIAPELNSTSGSGSELENDKRNSHNSNSSAFESQIQDLTYQLEAEKAKTAELKGDLEVLLERVDELEPRLAENEMEANEWKMKFQNLLRHVGEMNNDRFHTEEQRENMETMLKKIEEYERVMYSQSQEIINKDKEISKLTETIQGLTSKLQALEQQY